MTQSGLARYFKSLDVFIKNSFKYKQQKKYDKYAWNKRILMNSILRRFNYSCCRK